MGLSGARSNQDSTAHERLDLLNFTRVRILDQVGCAPIFPAESTILRPIHVRPLIPVLLVDADAPMRMIEIHMAVEQAVGTHVKRSTIKNALSDLAKDPRSLVRRVSYGHYSIEAGVELPDASRPRAS